jgi:hypothetical protein
VWATLLFEFAKASKRPHNLEQAPTLFLERHLSGIRNIFYDSNRRQKPITIQLV